MKQFNLKEYLVNPSRQVVTRDGKPARIVCTDAKGRYPVVALIYNEKDNREDSHLYRWNGCFIEGQTSNKDLVFETTKHEGWANLYRVNNVVETGTIYTTKEEALSNALGTNYIDTVHIEWEEE